MKDLHPEIADFVNTIKKEQEITLRIQNEYFEQKTNFDILNTNNLTNPYFLKKLESYNSSLVDISSLKVIFFPNNIDGLGDPITTDRKGRIYAMNAARPSFRYIFNSVWDLVGGKTKFLNSISNQNKIHIDNITFIEKITPVSTITKFAIHGCNFSTYKNQFSELEAKSNGTIKIEDLRLKEYEDYSKIDKLDCIFLLNGIPKTISISNSKWYDFHFPYQLNMILNSVNSSYRLSIVHENSWDETHGYKISTKEEYKILRSQNLIIEY